MTRRLGVLGLGAMGLSLARRLAREGRGFRGAGDDSAGSDSAGFDSAGFDSAGFDVAGFDIADARRAQAAAAGLEVAASASDLAAGADVLIVVLPGAADERSALLSDEGASTVLSMLRPGSMVLELTSGAPEVSRELARACERRGAQFVSAPMTGNPAAAEEGALGFFVAGAEPHVAKARGVLEVLADPDRIHVVSHDPGAAQIAKLLVNALWFGQAALVGEVLLLGDRCGIPPDRMQSLLAASAAGSRFVDEYVPRLLQGDYVDSFGVDGVIEQLDTVVKTARMRQAPGELLEHVRDLHLAARDRFGSTAGELLVVKLLEDRAGTRLTGVVVE